MNYLDLCRALRGDCGIQGDGPSTVVQQTGMLAKLVRWVSDGYVELQSEKHPWKFMRGQRDLALPVGAVSTPLSTFDVPRGSIDGFDGARALVVSATDAMSFWPIYKMDYDQFLDTYPYPQPPGIPTAVTISPEGTLLLNVAPDRPLLLRTGVVYQPQILVNDIDVPALPAKFHTMLVHKARMKYAGHDEASFLFQHANTEYSRLYTNLVHDQVPAVVMGTFPIVGRGGGAGVPTSWNPFGFGGC